MAVPLPDPNEVSEFIARIADPARRADCERLVRVTEEVTGEPPALWGGIIGFGARHYRYESGREGDTMLIGIAPRKQALTVYGVIFYDRGRGLLDELGPHETGKGCLYLRGLGGIDMGVLRRMIKAACDAHRSQGA